MSLYSEAQKTTYKMVETETPDGMGGHTTAWVASDSFLAAISTSATLSITFADKDSGDSTYDIYTDKSVLLKYDDIIKQSGKYYKITSDNDLNETPLSANINMRYCTAVKWVIDE